jgi:hypothetical protein
MEFVEALCTTRRHHAVVFTTQRDPQAQFQPFLPHRVIDF